VQKKTLILKFDGKTGGRFAIYRVRSKKTKNQGGNTMTSIMIALVAVLTAFELSGVSIGQIEDKLSKLPEAGQQIVQGIAQGSAGISNPLSVKHEDEKTLSAAQIVRVPCDNCTTSEELNNYYTEK
jgi:hypothetical protein